MNRTDISPGGVKVTMNSSPRIQDLATQYLRPLEQKADSVSLPLKSELADVIQGDGNQVCVVTLTVT